MEETYTAELLIMELQMEVHLSLYYLCIELWLSVQMGVNE